MTRYHGFRKILSLFLLFNILAFVLMFFFKKNDINVFMYGGIITTLLSAACIIIILKQLGDEYIFILISMLVSIGSIMIYRLDPIIFKLHKFHPSPMQIKWIAIGTAFFFITYSIYTVFHKKWQNFFLFYFLLSIFLFVCTLAFGTEINGSKNWLKIGPQSIQPAEFVKIMFVFMLASQAVWLNKKKSSHNNHNTGDINQSTGQFHHNNFSSGNSGFFQSIIEKYKIPKAFFIMGCVYTMIGFLILQKDWGTALELFVIYSIMTYAFEDKKTIMTVVIPNILFAIFGTFAGYYMTDHIKSRIDPWLDPWPYIDGGGYQIIRSMFSIASGDFFGRGVGMGYLSSVPEIHTDFIFAAICEEMGTLGGCAVILLFFILVYRGLKISMSIKNPFHKRVALGITSLFGIQTFIIIGGVTKMIPLTGITLPFVSYGGSSLLSGFVSLGILLAVSNRSIDKEV